MYLEAARIMIELETKLSKLINKDWKNPNLKYRITRVNPHKEYVLVELEYWDTYDPSESRELDMHFMWEDVEKE